MPAILVETAFIDNYDDNKFLASENGKKACAVAIYKGVCDYLGIGYTFSATKETTESEDVEMKEKIAELENRIKALENPMIYDYIDDNMPDWARPTITKLVSKGLLQGDKDGKLGLTEDLMRMLVINDRAGVYIA